MIRSAVDFPHPDGPTRTRTSPDSTVMSTPARAACSAPGYCRTTPSRTSLAMRSVGASSERRGASKGLRSDPLRRSTWFVVTNRLDALPARPRPLPPGERDRQRVPRVARHRHERRMDRVARRDQEPPDRPAPRLHPRDQEQGPPRGTRGAPLHERGDGQARRLADRARRHQAERHRDGRRGRQLPRRLHPRRSHRRSPARSGSRSRASTARARAPPSERRSTSSRRWARPSPTTPSASSPRSPPA